MEFDNSFDVPLSPAQAWAVLMDIRRIAPCMPGAALTEVVDAQNFRGKIAVRLGPVALAFAGRVQFEADVLPYLEWERLAAGAAACSSSSCPHCSSRREANGKSVPTSS